MTTKPRRHSWPLQWARRIYEHQREYVLPVQGSHFAELEEDAPRRQRCIGTCRHVRVFTEARMHGLGSKCVTGTGKVVGNSAVGTMYLRL